jgi:hypothetical protein
MKESVCVPNGSCVELLSLKVVDSYETLFPTSSTFSDARCLISNSISCII